ncbi:MAG: nicotinate-nucleotide--dimethylbenzimidazole phosphoribosyltransferase [Anaerolineae bacterium]|nr:nicotinate-nucleotide--dimethylbenzimidazole phosphoribosyltransferase [Anaerolineae bacterium]
MLHLPPIPPLDVEAMRKAAERQNTLTKPLGSLGLLELLATQLAGMQGCERPHAAQPCVIVIAGDHGITRQGVSAYPAEVTPQMVINYLRGGAAVNVLARNAGAHMLVADFGVAADLPPHPNLILQKIAYATRDFSHEPAMSLAQAEQAIEQGIALANRAIDQHNADLIALGDMGIGNTTASAAIIAALTGKPASEVTGRGTGIDDASLQRKTALIENALSQYELHLPNYQLHTGEANVDFGLKLLQHVGGFEIGGLCGVIIGAAARRVPVLVDGLITSAAAVLAAMLAPDTRKYLIAAHLSVERGHRVALGHLGLKPLFDLEMRLGEGSGAALAIPIVSAACKLLDQMATFAEAGVSNNG